MNRKNLTAAVLAGLAGVAGIVGSAQASLLSIGEMFAAEVPGIVITMNAPDAVAELSGGNELDTMTVHIFDVEEVDAVRDYILATEIVVAVDTGGANSGPLMSGQEKPTVMDSMSKGDILPVDIVGHDGSNGRLGHIAESPASSEQRQPQTNHFTTMTLST